MRVKLHCTIVLLLFYVSSLFSQDFNYQALFIKEDLKTNANAVLRHNETNIEIKSQQSMLVSCKRVITVLNKNGDKNVDLYLHYDKNVDIDKIQAIVYDGLGKEIKKIRRKDFKDVSAVSGGTLYSDSRLLYMEYTPVSYPYTVEFTYEFKTSNTAFIPSWRPLEDYYLSSEFSKASINDLAGLSVRHKEKNFENFPEIENHTMGNTVSYSAKGLKALKPEDYSISLFEYAPKVLFATTKFHLEGVDGTATDWGSMGKWQYDKLLQDRDELSQQTQYEILKLVNGIADPIEKARVIYKYVQNNTRYISVQVGIGGWMPIDAKIVDAVKYGDCKGLTNYTKALLKVAGVESYYSVVYAGKEQKSMENDFASMQGNHVILNIPTEKGDTWLECTSQISPFGFLGDFTDNRDVLVITPEGGKIKHTTVFKENENHQKTEAEFFINENGNINGKVSIQTKGVQYDNRFYVENLPKDEVIKRYKNYWGNINNLTITDYTFQNDKENVLFTEKVQISASDYASKTGDRLMVVLNAFNKSREVPDKYKNRKMPLKIDRGYLDEDEFMVHLPNGFEIEAMPKNEILETKYGVYQIEFIKNEDRSIAYRRKVLMKEGSFPKEDYEAFRNFKKDITRLDNSKIVLIKK